MAGIAAKAFRTIQFGLDLCEKFSVSAGLLPGEFAVLAADGAVALVFLFRGGQFCFDSGDGDGEVLLGEFTFPDGDDGPGEGVEALGIEFVAGDGAGHFPLPEVGVAFRDDIFGAAAVAVPEAAVDEDDGSILGQDEVGGTGQASVVEPVAIAPAPKFIPDGPLGGRVLRADAGHAVVPLGGGQSVGIMWHEIDFVEQAAADGLFVAGADLSGTGSASARPSFASGSRFPSNIPMPARTNAISGIPARIITARTIRTIQVLNPTLEA